MIATIDFEASGINGYPLEVGVAIHDPARQPAIGSSVLRTRETNWIIPRKRTKTMSADIIAFPSRSDISMRSNSGFDDAERSFRASERFIENQYRNLDRVSPEELAARARALQAARKAVVPSEAAWETALPSAILISRCRAPAPAKVTRVKIGEHELYRVHESYFFRNCIARGADPRVVARALHINGSHQGDTNSAFIDIGNGRPDRAYEAALAAPWPTRPSTRDKASTAS